MKKTKKAVNKLAINETKKAVTSKEYNI